MWEEPPVSGINPHTALVSGLRSSVFKGSRRCLSSKHSALVAIASINTDVRI